MIKVSVVSTKELYKSTTKIAIIIIILLTLVGIIKYSRKNLNKIELSTNKCISYIAEEITVMGNLDQKNPFELNPEDILDSEIKIQNSITSRNADSIEYANNEEDESEESQLVNQQQIDTQEDELQEVSTNVTTQVQKSTYKETYNYQVEGVKIKNETNFNLGELQLSSSNVNLKNKNVIIFHTHTCESYTQTENNKYVPSGNYRTTDLNHSVASVGDELQKYLTNYGFNVIHDKTYHDYPAYTGSYGRSLKTVSNILSTNKNTDIIIDLHRDAMSDETYAPKVKIGDEYVSQIMFVIGTNGSGLEHDNWKQNLEFAIKVQKKANEMYPGLCKPIILRNARYNQQLGSAATIIEFGATRKYP